MDKVSKDSNNAKSYQEKIGQNKILSLIALLVFVIVIITVVVLVFLYFHQKGKTIFCTLFYSGNWFEGFLI